MQASAGALAVPGYAVTDPYPAWLMQVKTRFAPSPTGMLHIGGVRTALFSWLYARKNQGKFVLRIEDTDRERSSGEAIDVILEAMNWLGLDFDEGPYYQTRRFDRYKEVVCQLLDQGHAYYCYCTKEEVDAMRVDAIRKGLKPRYNGYWRDRDERPPENVDPVVRFKTPLEGEVVVNDLVQGNVVFRNQELDDLIIARADGSPTYNLTVVVDDMDMQISHVIRGDDHLNNTPRQINILRALGAGLPQYAHVPMILNEDGKKLSKRIDAAGVLHYRREGYLPEALLNYLVRLGWSHGDQEIFNIDAMIELFNIVDVDKSAARVNSEKLTWLNQHYLRETPDAYLAAELKKILEAEGIAVDDGPALEDLVAVQKHRTKTLQDMARQSLCFYSDFDDFDESAAHKHLRPVVMEIFRDLRRMFGGLDIWSKDTLGRIIESTAENCGMKLGKVAQPLRVAVTGSGVSPSIDDTLFLVGRDRVLRRLDKALEYIEKRAVAAKPENT